VNMLESRVLLGGRRYNHRHSSRSRIFVCTFLILVDVVSNEYEAKR
jgi:hypothetical protein